jgi:thioesterase domain-containing protein
VRLHLLPGDHWSFLSEPEVAEVARLLEEAVVESATSNPSTSTEPVLQES